MKYFTLNECKKLIKYYSEKLIGKILIDDIIIETLKIESYENDENMVFCVGKRNQLLNPRKNIIVVAEKFNLLTPDEVLKEVI